MDITLANFNMLYVRTLESTEQEIHVPLGPLYLISILERADIGVDFRDYQLEVGSQEDAFGQEAICTFLKDPEPIVGISCMANLLPFIILGLKRLKEKYPQVTVILGGVAARNFHARQHGRGRYGGGAFEKLAARVGTTGRRWSGRTHDKVLSANGVNCGDGGHVQGHL